MNKYEKLCAEYEQLDIIEKPSSLPGFIINDCVLIDKNMSDAKKACVMAEEIGHYETSVGDITDQSDMNSVKQEYRARVYAVQKILPKGDILRALDNVGPCIWDVAEEIGVDPEFLVFALRYYRLIDF